MIIGTEDVYFFWDIYNLSKWSKEWQAKYGYLILPGTFPDKVTPDIDFTNEFQCGAPVAEIVL